MNKKYSLLLFDMDGTIANTDEMIIRSWNDLYDLYRGGKRKTREEIYYFSGPPIRETLKKEFPELDQEKLLTLFHQISKSYYRDYITPFPNCRETLKELKEEGCTLAVVTNKMHDLAEYVLEIVHLEDLFDFVVGADDVAKGKPNPEGILKAMEKTGIGDKKSVLYIGDNGIDYDTAYQAGVDCVLVTWGPRKLPDTAKSRYQIDEYSKLKEVIYGK